MSTQPFLLIWRENSFCPTQYEVHKRFDCSEHSLTVKVPISSVQLVFRVIANTVSQQGKIIWRHYVSENSF